MRIALGADERTTLTDFLAAELQRRGFDVELAGAPAGKPIEWAEVAATVASLVASGTTPQGVLCCWTGTGVSIAANKVPGVRAALCADAETARGARRWNDANVLCLSLRNTSETIAREILDAWFESDFDASEEANVARVRAMEQRRS